MGKIGWIALCAILGISLVACGDDTTGVITSETAAPDSIINDGAEPTATTTDAIADGPILVDQAAPGPACALVPEEGELLSIYTDADTTSELLGRLEVGHYVLAAAFIDVDDGWYQISYPATSLDGAFMPQTGAFLVDECVCGPDCYAFDIPADAPEITDCNLSYAADVPVITYLLPSTQASTFGFSTLGDDSAGVAIARTADGWIGFDPGTPGSARADGLSRLVWIEDGEAVTLRGDQCVELPMYSYTPIISQ